MEKVFELIITQLADSGLSFLLLAVAIYYFHQINKELKKKIENVQTELTKYLREDREELLRIIEHNSTMLESMKKFIESKVFA